MPPRKAAAARKTDGEKAAAAAQREAQRAAKKAERAAAKAAERVKRAAQTAAKRAAARKKRQAKKDREKAENAAEKEAARQEKIDRAERLAAKVELPTHPQDDLLVIPVTQIPPRKRTANSAYDDRDGIKRRKFDDDSNSEDGPILFPWERDRTLEQPPDPFDLGLGFDDQTIDPTEALGAFKKLAAEIREKILRYILICDHDIAVLKGWSLVYPRKKPRLDLAIMSTCKVLRLQGLRILFGQNTFLYDIRDPAPHHKFTLYHGVVFERSSIPINQYGHLIRHIKINIPINRMSIQNSEFFHKAIAKFLPGQGLLEPANLHTLTIILLVDMKWALENDPRMLLGKYFTSAAKAIYSLNLRYIRILAQDTAGSLFEHTIDLRCSLWKRDGEAGEKLARDCEGARGSFLRQVSLGRARVHNISTRIWELIAFGAVEANRAQLYWKYLGEGVQKSHVRETVSLPEDWEEEVEEVEPQMEILQLENLRRSREKKIKSTMQWLAGLSESGFDSVDNEDVDDD